jgi:ligand-binding sensor domain-containing protein
MIDDQNTIWVATSNGIMHFDGSNWKVYTSDDGLADNYISKVIQDKSGNIWSYGFYSGLNLYNGRSWQYFISDNRIVDNAQDKNGNIWFASDHGVIKYDGNSFQTYTTVDGLLDNSISRIIIDNNNDVWCGTDYGVNYYNGKSWQSFTPREGLAGSQILHIGNDKSGDIWFSSFGGVSRYTPTK